MHHRRAYQSKAQKFPRQFKPTHSNRGFVIRSSMQQRWFDCNKFCRYGSTPTSGEGMLRLVTFREGTRQISTSPSLLEILRALPCRNEASSYVPNCHFLFICCGLSFHHILQDDGIHEYDKDIRMFENGNVCAKVVVVASRRSDKSSDYMASRWYDADRCADAISIGAYRLGCRG